MSSFARRAPLVLALAAVCAACPGPDADEPGGARAETSAAPAVPPAPAPAPAATPPAAAEAADTGAPVVIRYEHFRTCARFLGREGQFLVYRILGIENRGSAPFSFRSEMLLFPGGEGAGAGTAPKLMVPELVEAEVPAGATEPSQEMLLLERAGSGPPPRGAVPLAYEAPGVAMVRGSAEPAYDEGTGCDEFNT